MENGLINLYNSLTIGELEILIKEIKEVDKTGLFINAHQFKNFLKQVEKITGTRSGVMQTDTVLNIFKTFAYKKLDI